MLVSDWGVREALAHVGCNSEPYVGHSKPWRAQDSVQFLAANIPSLPYAPRPPHTFPKTYVTIMGNVMPRID